jgi:hypothetical protein
MLRNCSTALLLGIYAAGSRAQAVPSADGGLPAKNGAQVGFQYENPQLQPAQYIFMIAEDGSGHFHSEPGKTPPKDSASYHPLADALDRPVQLSAPVVGQIFSTARSQKFFATPCEDQKNKVAFEGIKRLSYNGPDGHGSCSYNWSKFAPIQKLTDIFESIAFTLEEGRRLEVERKHDRLALDAELGDLLDAAKNGRAIELQNIKPILQEIIDDDSLLARARSRAQKLLGDEDSSNASLPLP